MIKKLIKRIVYKFARRKFVRGFDKYCKEKSGRALVYFKTEEFLLNGIFQDFSHTNNWESYELACVLNRLGFVVDIIDRTADLNDIKKIKDIYKIFIGIGVGDSGKYFPDIAERIPSAIRVLFAMGPEPNLSDRVTRERHNYFRERHPEFPIVDRRLISNVNTKRLYAATDAIITIGNKWSFGSYSHLGKDVYKIYLSSYSGLKMLPDEHYKKSQKSFLYFGGNGNVTKGLDIALDAFKKLPDLDLYVGAPESEEDFNVFYKTIIECCQNIHPLGFVDVTSEKFKNITQMCGYVILPSASEGCATSVTTCMRRGLIPIVTIESGIEVDNFGYLITDIRPDKLAEQLKIISETDRAEFDRRIIETYKQSSKYTESNFTFSLKKALTEILNKGKLKNEKI